MTAGARYRGAVAGNGRAAARSLFKDEVRALGRKLGLPPDLVNHHPFSGPGLAIRIPGTITREKLDLLRQIDGKHAVRTAA